MEFFSVAQHTSSKMFHKNKFVNNKTIYCLILRQAFGLFQIVQRWVTWRFLDECDLFAPQASVCLARASWVWRRAPCLICWPGPSPGTSSAWRVGSRLYECSCGWATRGTWRSSWTWSGWKRKVISRLEKHLPPSGRTPTNTCLQLSVLFQNVFISVFIKALHSLFSVGLVGRSF